MFHAPALLRAGLRDLGRGRIPVCSVGMVIAVLALIAVQPVHAKPAGTPAKDRPNIIVIMADDIGYECFGCYGSKQYQTPHIDRMAQRGMKFVHCYSQPLCTPSRVKLMTGLANVRNYSAFSVLNRDQKTIGQYFRAAGYRTAIAGKWQLLGAEHYRKQFRGKGTWPQDAGFERACLWQVDKLGERYPGPLLWIDGENKQFAADKYGPEVCTDYLIDFMKEHRDEPFFVYYPMILVHNPFVPTPDSKPRKRKNQQKNFEDMVAYMDKLVGRIVGATEELQISERTLILFLGDNGTNKAIVSELNGRTIRGGKGLMTDAGTRVPCVALWPGKTPAGSVNSDLIDFSDVLPTMLAATGQDVPESLDGKSFLPQLHGKSGHPREWISCYYCPRPERGKPSHFVRNHRWKLYDDGRFYDIEQDVLEKNPIRSPAPGTPAGKAHEQLTAAMKTLPDQWQTLLKFPETSAR